MRSRDELPDFLNAQGLLGVGVEVGTHRGAFAATIRREWLGKLLICVDTWESADYAPRASDDMLAATKALEAVGGEFTFVRKKSVDAAKDFALHGVVFDFVYIDAAHDYASVKEDILAWWPLVKKGGVLAGHDWVVDGWHKPNEAFVAFDTNVGLGPHAEEFGVRRAVTEFAHELDGVTLVNTTVQETDGGWQSWWIRKT